MDIDTILLLVFAAAFFVAVVVLAKVIRGRMKKKKEQRELIQRRLDSLRDESWKKVNRVNSTPLRTSLQSTPAVAPIKKSYSAPATTAPVTSSDDGFVTGMLTGMLLDDALKAVTHKSEPSVGVSKSESSWGFDDDDSRKSVSSSMSDSWSSSSSDSWSSSDSGPSSDW